MNNKSKKFSLASRGLNYKLKIAFYLMSILPLLVCMYLVSTYILPKTGIKVDIALSVIISVFIAVIGFFMIKDIFDSIVSVSSEAKLIAAGDLGRKLEFEREDEIGSLGQALNQLTERIRSNMDELRNYGQKTSEINFEIQKRVLMLSSLLQISSLISQGEKIEDILKIIVEKSRLLAESDFAYILFREEVEDTFYAKTVDGMNSQYLLDIKIEPQDPIFYKVNKDNKPLIFDKQNLLPPDLRDAFYEKFRIRNALLFPVYLRGRTIAVLGVGNNKDDFLYKRDDIELVNVFAKQMAIAVENDILIHRIKKLEIKDTLTGLYNETFIRVRLSEEIKRAIAYQRPCALIIFNIDNFRVFHQKFGLLKSEDVLKTVALSIRNSISEIDRAARIGDNEFAAITPEKTKRQAQEIAENIRKRIESLFSNEDDPDKRLTVSAGVSENPLDGVTTDELIRKAKDLLMVAKKAGKNRVISFSK